MFDFLEGTHVHLLYMYIADDVMAKRTALYN